MRISAYQYDIIISIIIIMINIIIIILIILRSTQRLAQRLTRPCGRARWGRYGARFWSGFRGLSRPLRGVPRSPQGAPARPLRRRAVPHLHLGRGHRPPRWERTPTPLVRVTSVHPILL